MTSCLVAFHFIGNFVLSVLITITSLYYCADVASLMLQGLMFGDVSGVDGRYQLGLIKRRPDTVPIMVMTEVNYEGVLASYWLSDDYLLIGQKFWISITPSFFISNFFISTKASKSSKLSNLKASKF